MEVMMFILVFVAVTLSLAALFLWLAPSRAQERLAQVGQRADAPHWSESVVKLSGPLARLSLPEGEWEASPLRIRFLNAGVRDPQARVVFFAAKTVLPVVMGLLAYAAMRTGQQEKALVTLFQVVSTALAGYYLPNAWLALRVRLRQREIFENFPDAADLMLVSVEAGMSLDASMTKVAEEMSRKSVALAEELQLTNLEMRAGAPREQALRNLALRTGVEETRSFATMLTQADRFGSSIGDSLRVFSDDLRHKRMTRAEERAAKVPTKMLFPLVLCIFPAILMVVLGPALIQVVRTLFPLLGGGR